MTIFAAIVASVSTSCGNDSDLFMEDPNSLDINFHVPLTRSSPQELINSTSYKEVPVEANECMLNALLKIAVINGIPVYQRYINSTYTAKQAYYAVRDSAIKYSQNSSLYEKPYGGGAMTPKLGAEVGEKSNILHGNLIKISNFNELYRLLSNPEWQYDRKCVINLHIKEKVIQAYVMV